MIKPIYRNNTFTTIDDQKTPKSFKELKGFLICNEGNDCFSKSMGKIYRITRNNNWIEICRNISDLTFDEYLKLSKLHEKNIIINNKSQKNQLLNYLKK